MTLPVKAQRSLARVKVRVLKLFITNQECEFLIYTEPKTGISFEVADATDGPTGIHQRTEDNDSNAYSAARVPGDS